MQEAEKLLARNDVLQHSSNEAQTQAQQQAVRIRKLEACVSLCEDSKSAVKLAQARKAAHQLQRKVAEQVRDQFIGVHAFAAVAPVLSTAYICAP